MRDEPVAISPSAPTDLPEIEALYPAALLGPLAVAPDRQRRRLG